MRDGSMHLVDGNRRAIWPYWARIDIRYDKLVADRNVSRDFRNPPSRGTTRVATSGERTWGSSQRTGRNGCPRLQNRVPACG